MHYSPAHARPLLLTGPRLVPAPRTRQPPWRTFYDDAVEVVKVGERHAKLLVPKAQVRLVGLRRNQ
jgi:hypothetical protein